MSAGSVVVGRQTGFVNAARLNRSLTATLEKRLLVWIAERAPAWVSSDGLTLLGSARRSRPVRVMRWRGLTGGGSRCACGALC
jgi:hypothetical protein